MKTMKGNKKRRTFLRELGVLGLAVSGAGVAGCETTAPGGAVSTTTGFDNGSRIPPNQQVTEGFPVLHVGSVPNFDPDTWDFTIEGLVENETRFTYDEFLSLPAITTVSDFHCVTGWSKLSNRWGGVSFKTVHDIVKPMTGAAYVTIASECPSGCPEQEYTTSLPTGELLDDDVLLAYELEGEPVTPVHGYPLRLVVPKKYAYKSAKWVRRLRFTANQEIGFWEQRGYSNTADPWKEERYS